VIGTILIAVAIIAVGTRAADAVRLRQQETILAKLPTAEAVAYYRILRRRAWTVRILRAVALLSLVVILYARNHGWQRDHAPTRRSSVGHATPTEASRVRYLAQRR
jgi:hypothetical protein